MLQSTPKPINRHSIRLAFGKKYFQKVSIVVSQNSIGAGIQGITFCLKRSLI